MNYNLKLFFYVMIFKRELYRIYMYIHTEREKEIIYILFWLDTDTENLYSLLVVHQCTPGA